MTARSDIETVRLCAKAILAEKEKGKENAEK